MALDAGPRLGFIVLMLLAHAGVARGQVVNGSILGLVRDPTGAVMAAVSVTAKSLETGAVRTATTDGTGVYQILSVPVGDYEIRASAPRFLVSIRNGVSVTVGAAVNVNFDLALGGVTQEVTVRSESPQGDPP